MGGFVEASEYRYLIILAIIFLRYLILASVAFSIFYWAKRTDWSYRKIQQKFPVLADYRSEFLYSASTTIIFATLGYLFFFGPLAPYTRVYKDIHEHSMGYFVASIGITLLIHDTYFYWMHRLIHHPALYGYFHKVHHLSINPSPRS